MQCPNCGAADVPEHFFICPKCGVSPGVNPAEVPPANLAETLIPTRNPQALTAYYLGLFGSLMSCIPLIGFVGLGMSFASLIFGLKGRRAAVADPRIKGEVHAWIGIVGGVLGILFGILVQGGMLVALIVSLLRGR